MITGACPESRRVTARQRVERIFLQKARGIRPQVANRKKCPVFPTALERLPSNLARLTLPILTM